MKKLLSVVLFLALVLGLCACTINKTEVSILWSGELDHAVAPNSLINAMDRAMYMENIAYTHYAANNDQAIQTQQATDCLEKGCSALMVELVDATAAQTIVDLAKAKNVPVIFFGCNVDAAVVSSYEKCACVYTDPTTLDSSFFDMVSKYVVANTQLTEEGEEPANDDLDLNDDGKISFITVGELSLAETLAVEKDKDGQPKLEEDGSYTKAVELVQLSAAFEDLQVIEEVTLGGLFGGTTTYRYLQTPNAETVELILVADDLQAMDILLALQELDLNTNQLATCFVPVFTVGADADYKAYVMASLPTEEEARKAYLEQMALVADMTTLKQGAWDDRAAGLPNEVDSMVFNTLNQVDAGRMSGTAVEDYDALAEAAAKLAAQLLEGTAPAEWTVAIPYTTYSN